MAPDVGPPPVPPLPNYHAPSGPVLPTQTSAHCAPGSSLAGPVKKASGDRHTPQPPRLQPTSTALDLSDNLIDLNSDVPIPAKCEMERGAGAGAAPVTAAPALALAFGLGAGERGPLPPYIDHEYVNDVMGSGSDFRTTPTAKDPFDMRNYFALTLTLCCVVVHHGCMSTLSYCLRRPFLRCTSVTVTFCVATTAQWSFL